MTHPSDEWCDALAERVRREVRESGEFEDRALIRAALEAAASECHLYAMDQRRHRLCAQGALDCEARIRAMGE